MNNVTWAIQSNLISSQQSLAVWNSALECGAKVQEVIVIPFSEEFNLIQLLGIRDLRKEINY